MSTILLSAASSSFMVALKKHLKEKGHYIIGIDMREHEVSTQYTDEFYRVPAGSHPDYVDAIQPYLERVDLFFPYVDSEMDALSKAFPFANGHKVVMSEASVIELTNDKRLFQLFCEDVGLPIIPRALSEQDLPALAKPVRGEGGKDQFNILTESDLAFFLRNQGYLVQKKISGREYTVDVLCDNDGTWVFGLCRERLLARGISLRGKAVDDVEIISLCRLLTEKVLFRGPINIQLIRDEVSHNLYILEVNARLSGSVSFTVAYGFDIVSEAIELFLHGQKNTSTRTINYNMIIERYWEELHVKSG